MGGDADSLFSNKKNMDYSESWRARQNRLAFQKAKMTLALLVATLIALSGLFVTLKMLL